MANKTVESVTATDTPLLMPVKANQPTLFERLTATDPAPQPQDPPHSHEVGRHNRIEQRPTRRWNLPPGAGREAWHDHFCPLSEVHRSTEGFDTRQKHWGPRQATAYYLSTVARSAAEAADASRHPWGIENRSHYGRDVTRGEDASRLRRNPGSFARLRSFARNRLRFNDLPNISLELYDKALDFNRLLAYKGL